MKWRKLRLSKVRLFCFHVKYILSCLCPVHRCRNLSQTLWSVDTVNVLSSSIQHIDGKRGHSPNPFVCPPRLCCLSSSFSLGSSAESSALPQMRTLCCFCISWVAGEQRGRGESDQRSRGVAPGWNGSSPGGHLKGLRGMFWGPPCSSARKGLLWVAGFFNGREMGCAPAQVPPVKDESSPGSIKSGWLQSWLIPVQ